MGQVVRIAVALLAAVAAFGQAAEEARRSYNQIYKDPSKVFSAEPSAFLVRMLAGRPPGRALDIGMGQGRNALWLASQGWEVTGIDVSDEGLAQARGEAERRGLRLRTVRASYSEFDYGVAQWDLVVLSYFLPRDLPARLLRALKPGGIVVVEAFHAETAFVRLLPDGFADNELFQLFAGYRTLHYEDVMAPAEWGGALAAGNRLVRLLAQRPNTRPAQCTFDGRAFEPAQAACWGPIELRCSAAGWVRSGPCENRKQND